MRCNAQLESCVAFPDWDAVSVEQEVQKISVMQQVSNESAVTNLTWAAITWADAHLDRRARAKPGGFAEATHAGCHADQQGEYHAGADQALVD